MSWLHSFIELFIPADLIQIDGTIAANLPHPDTAVIAGTRIALNQIDGTLTGTTPHPLIASITGALSVGGYDRDYTTASYVGMAAPACARTASGFAQTTAGALTSFSANTLRRTNRGLLIEPSRTNLLTRSATLGTTWTATNITVGDNEYVAPDGTTTMESLQDSASNAQHSISEAVSVTLGTKYCWSVYIDPVEDPRVQLTLSNTGFGAGHVNFNLTSKSLVASNGVNVVTAQAMEKMANGQYRVALIDTATATTGSSAAILGRIASDGGGRLASYAGSSTKIGAWGAQMEAGAFPTSPIITTATSATRDGDIITIASNALSKGSLIISAQAPPYNGTHVLWEHHDGTESNRLRLYRDSSGNIRGVVTVSGVEIANLNGGYVCPFGTFIVFFGWAANNYSICVNGNQVVSQASGGTPPATLTTIQVGGDTDGNQWESWIQRETLYYARISDGVGKVYATYPTLYNPRPQILLDTDIDSDIDDVCDILTLLALEKQRECDIAGICVSSANGAAAGCLYAILNYYSRTAIPIGQNAASLGYASSPYDSEVVAAFGVPGKISPSDFPSGLSIYRQICAAAADNSITVVTTGGLSTLADFLNSPADGYSPLTGLELCAQKVREVCCVAGYWPGPNGAIISDMYTCRTIAEPSILRQCPVPLIMAGIELGDDSDIDTGGEGTFTNLPLDNPARGAWVTFWNHAGVNPVTASRTGWAQVAILALVRGMQDYMYYAGEHGRLYQASNGKTTFYTNGPVLNGGYLRFMSGVSGPDITADINDLISTGGILTPASFTIAPASSQDQGVIHIVATGVETHWSVGNPFSILSGPGTNLTNYVLNSETSAEFDFTLTTASGVPVLIYDSDSETSQEFGTTPAASKKRPGPYWGAQKYVLPPGWKKKPTIKQVKKLYAEAREVIPPQKQRGLLPVRLRLEGRTSARLPPLQLVDFEALRGDLEALRSISIALLQAKEQETQSVLKRRRDEESIIWLVLTQLWREHV